MQPPTTCFVGLREPQGWWIGLALSLLTHPVSVAAQDTDPPEIQFLQTLETALESDEQIEIPVRLNGSLPLGTTVSVDCVEEPAERSPATSGVDYLFSPTTLQLTALAREKVVRIPLLTDGLVEGNERFRLSLLNPTSPAQLGSAASVEIVIQDNETDFMLLDSPTFSPRSAVTALLALPGGGAIVAGLPAEFDYLSRDALWRLSPNGQPDHAFHPPALGFASAYSARTVALAERSDGSILRLISVQASDGSSSLRLMAHAADGGVDEVFETPEALTNHWVTTLAVDAGGGILIGGQELLVRLRPNGTSDQSFKLELPSGAHVSALVPLSNGSVLAAGSALVSGPASGSPLVRLQTDGSIDESFSPGLGGAGSDLWLLPDGRILVAGRYPMGTENGERSLVWRLEADGTLDATFQPDPFLSSSSFTSSSYVCGLPDGRAVVAVNSQWKWSVTCRVYVLSEEGTLERTLMTASWSIDGIELLENGDLLVAGSFEGTLLGKRVRKLVRLRTMASDASALTFAYTDRLVGESSETVSARVVRVGRLTEPAIARVAAVSGSATMGSDFAGEIIDLEFLPLEEEKRVLLQLKDDFVPEADEFFEIRSLESGDPRELAAEPFRVRIRDDDRSGALIFSRQLVGRVLAPTYQSVRGLWRSRQGELAVMGSLALPDDRSAQLALLGPDDSLRWSLKQGSGNILGAAPLQNREWLVLHDSAGEPGQLDLWRINSCGQVVSSNEWVDAGNPVVLFPVSDGTSFLAVWDTTGERMLKLDPQGKAVPGFKAFRSGYAQCVVTTAAGWIYVGTINGRVWRLNAEGQIDTRFGVEGCAGPAQIDGTESDIRVLLPMSTDKLVVGGAFTSFAGLPCGGLIRLETDGTVDESFQRLPGAEAAPDGSSGPRGPQVLALAPHPMGKLWVAGGFARFHGQSRAGVTLLHHDGSLDTAVDFGSGLDLGFSGPFQPVLEVNAIVPEPDGSLLLGGSFHRFDEFPYSALVRVRGDLRVIRLYEVKPMETGNLRLRFSSLPGRDYELWATSDLSTWQLVGSQNVEAYESEWLVDPSEEKQRIYRIKQR